MTALRTWLTRTYARLLLWIAFRLYRIHARIYDRGWAAYTRESDLLRAPIPNANALATCASTASEAIESRVFRSHNAMMVLGRLAMCECASCEAHEEWHDKFLADNGDIDVCYACAGCPDCMLRGHTPWRNPDCIYATFPYDDDADRDFLVAANIDPDTLAVDDD